MTSPANPSRAPSRVTRARAIAVDVSRRPWIVHVVSLVLSLFPGIDLLGRGFELEGFCVVRGPDLVWGGDIKQFSPPGGKFSGVIGGPPCQNFSTANASRDPAAGMVLVREFIRCVAAAAPDWFVMENTPGVPRIEVAGFKMQRFTLNAGECGGRQRRNRVFQFGSRDGTCLICDRGDTPENLEPTCLAGEGSHPVRKSWGRVQARRSWNEFCELQGLPGNFELPGMSVSARYRAVGNGVPVYMARVIARAVRNRQQSRHVTLCACGCGRGVTVKQIGHVCATVACRKRLERQRRDSPDLSKPGPVTVGV